MMDLLSMLPEEIRERLPDQPAYRAEQIFSWLPKAPSGLGEMSSIPKGISLPFYPPKQVKRQISSDGTQKLLFELEDGQLVESVIMRYNTGKSICVSSQAGCRQGCAFCASTLGGKVRDLTAGEILGQVFYCGEQVSNVVLMGIGEPLDNFDNVVKFLKLLSHPKGRNMSLRHVSLSTCGLVDEILRLAELGLPVTLSVSLHAADDETRNLIMPVNKNYGIERLVHSVEIYFDKTGRRISYEYVMIEGVNDSEAQAVKLVKLLRGRPSHVNLIPFNHVSGKPYRQSPPGNIKKFAKILDAAHIETTVRRKLGADIDAACGQLRAGMR